MDVREKLNLLGQGAQHDVCGLFANPSPEPPPGRDMQPYISHVAGPGGRGVPILKVLQTSACQNDCRYCAFRADRDAPRARFTPDELARSFDLMQRAGAVQGLFLSSAIAGTTQTMDDILATAELLRGRYAFRGYLHLKLLPGVEQAQIERAVTLADRVSINLEAPTAPRLAELAPKKQMPDLLEPLRIGAQVIQRLHDRPERRLEAPAGYGRLGLSTQFVVGPADETDRELLGMAQSLYREVGLARAYYSRFTPVPGTPLQDAAAEDPRREFRLYQADFLLRRYGFAAEELPFDAQGRLGKGSDPKAAWAAQHPERFPVEVNRAGLAELLRVPGIGPVTARAILQARRQGALRTLGDLRRLGARAEQAAPFVVLAGRRPPWQPPLPFSDANGSSGGRPAREPFVYESQPAGQPPLPFSDATDWTDRSDQTDNRSLNQQPWNP